ncbi:MAG: hypothetical protein GTO18_05590 [Anaerolineales bacterium]|nr:hypothetical protein [Anaerolineales bacterium]
MSDWTLQFVDDSSNWQIVNGVLEQSGKGDQNDILPYVNDKVILTGRPKIRDIHVEVDYYTGDDDLGGFGLCSNDKSPTGFYVGMTADRWFDSENVSSRVGYWLSETNHGYTETSVPLPAEYDVQLAWTSSQVQSSFNGKQFSWGVGPGGANYFCMVLNGMSGVIYDNLVIRHYVNPEPSVKLGLEESRS